MRRFGILVLLALLGGCGERGTKEGGGSGGGSAPQPAAVPPTGPGSTAPASGGWTVETVLGLGRKVGGVTVGDLDPRHAGNEVAAVTATGEVWVVHREGTEWKGELVARLAGEMIQCFAGDLDPGRPGQELLAVGMAEGTEDSGGKGAAFALWLDGDSWKTELLAEDDALVHGGCVWSGRGYLVGFSRRATEVVREGDSWRVRPVADLPGPGKIAVPTAISVLVGCASGEVLESVHDPKTDAWTTTVLARGTAGQSRLGTDGARIVSAGDDGVLSLLERGRDGGGGRLVPIHRDDAKLRGAVIAELDAASPGPEVATTGYSGRIAVLRERDGRWEPELVHEEGEPLHHLAVGELDERNASRELVACGYGGKVLLLRRAPSR